MVNDLSPDILYEREIEKNRQNRIKFDEFIRQSRGWFFYRISAAIVIIFIIFVVFVVSIYIVLNSNSYSENVVLTFAVALIVDIIGTFLSIVKVIFNPKAIPQLDSNLLTGDSENE
jgi:ABC-type protease/lipase transport system fused ATPase/permease subunit